MVSLSFLHLFNSSLALSSIVPGNRDTAVNMTDMDAKFMEFIIAEDRQRRFGECEDRFHRNHLILRIEEKILKKKTKLKSLRDLWEISKGLL